jgi:hypothetical protein
MYIAQKNIYEQRTLHASTTKAVGAREGVMGCTDRQKSEPKETGPRHVQ